MSSVVLVALLIVAALVVMAIALLIVGRVTRELAMRPPPSVFDLDEAVEWVADRLPADVAGRLTHEDVRHLLGWQLDYLESRGVASETTAEVLRQDQGERGPVVVDEEHVLAHVLDQVARARLEVDDTDVVVVLDAGSTYLGAIGALGAEVTTPPDPEDA